MCEKTLKIRALAASSLMLAALVFGVPQAFAGPKRNTSGASAPLNQRDTQITTYQTSDKGSDESLRNSAVYAMQALMDLANTKLPSAMKNGYNAYGKFRNAENLDRVKDQAALQANSLGSVGSDPVLKVPVKTNTSFRRLDPSFLRDGDAAKVAAEFERQTGMKREEFLTQIADVSERKIKRSDPMMIDKAFSNFEGFIHKIPNAEFRKKAEKNIALVPNSVRRGIVAQAVQKLAGFFADAGPNAAPALDPSLTALATGKGMGGDSGAEVMASGSSANEGKTAPGEAAEMARVPAAASNEPSAPAGVVPGKPGKTGIDGVVAAAIRTQHLDVVTGGTDPGTEETSLFRQVSNRYRILTPQLSKVSN